jgi:uncharacterized membrane protein
MKALSTTVAVYDDLATAQKDWAALENAASTKAIDLADAALVQRNQDGEIQSIQRQEHHGWGKGMVAGAVVGILFPPSLIAGAVVGAGGGGLVSRLSRALDRGDIKDLGEAMDRGEIAIVVVSADTSTETVQQVLSGSKSRLSRGSSTAEDVQVAMDAEGLNT